MNPNLECILIELECLVADFCRKYECGLSEIEMLRRIALNVPVNPIGGYCGRHFKKN